jgi:hypothetical protein
MSKTPRTLIKSRETLQAIFNDWKELRKYEIFDSILDRIYGDIFMQPLKGKTKQVFHLSQILPRHSNITNLEAFRLELIEILKKEYPGCDVSYVETTGYDGKIVEKLIIIDWS